MKSKEHRHREFVDSLSRQELMQIAELHGVDLTDTEAVVAMCTVGPRAYGEHGYSRPVIAWREDVTALNGRTVDVEWTEGPIHPNDSHRFLRLLGVYIHHAASADDPTLRDLAASCGATAEHAARLLETWRNG